MESSAVLFRPQSAYTAAPVARQGARGKSREESGARASIETGVLGCLDRAGRGRSRIRRAERFCELGAIHTGPGAADAVRSRSVLPARGDRSARRARAAARL